MSRKKKSSQSLGIGLAVACAWLLVWFILLTLCSLLLSSGLKMLGTMAGMNQKALHVARGRARRRLRHWHVHGWFYWCCTTRCVPFFCLQAQYEPEGLLQGDRSCSFSGAGVEETVVLPQLQIPQLLVDKMIDVPSAAPRLFPMVQTVLRTIESPQLLVGMVDDVPGMRVVQVLRVPRQGC